MQCFRLLYGACLFHCWSHPYDVCRLRVICPPHYHVSRVKQNCLCTIDYMGVSVHDGGGRGLTRNDLMTESGGDLLRDDVARADALTILEIE